MHFTWNYEQKDNMESEGHSGLCNLTKHGSDCRIFLFALNSDIGNALHLFIKIIK